MILSNLRFGAATAALTASLIAGPAMAFDTTNWSWTLTRTDISTSTDTSALTAFPTGNAAVEARQIYIGDVNASANSSSSVVPSTAAIAPFDAAVELGHVDATSAAYANVYQANSEVPLSVSLGQFHVGAIGPTSGATPGIADPTATNPSHAYADTMIADAANGLYQPHDTNATATATDVTNATAATSARSVSNSASMELAAGPATLVGADPSGGVVTNALMASDLTQLSIGRVDSTATSATTLSGYGNLGSLDRPIAQASATSIGNLGTSTVRFGTLAIAP